MLGSVRVCGRAAGARRRDREGGGPGGAAARALGFGVAADALAGCAAAGRPTVAAALAVTDAVLLTVAVVPVAAQPVRAPAASTAPIVRHLTNEGHTRIGGGCTPRRAAALVGCAATRTPAVAAPSRQMKSYPARPARVHASVTGNFLADGNVGGWGQTGGMAGERAGGGLEAAARAVSRARAGEQRGRRLTGSRPRRGRGSRAPSPCPPRPRRRPGGRSAKGEDTLVIAPTGSGKTLAAFLWAIDRLAADAAARRPQAALAGCSTCRR